MAGTITDQIDQKEIRTLIPHSGAMCLLESVQEWGEESIICTSRTHLDRANPLRRNETLSAIHAFEYGAQAVAIHGGLRARRAGTSAPPGYLAAIRDASVNVPTLDQFNCALTITAHPLFSDKANSVYNCVISAANRVIAQARVTIILRDVGTSAKTKPDHGVSLSRNSQPIFEIHRSIQRDHPSLPGHFPDEPIVPGVVILDEVRAALAQWRQGRIAQIHFAKFLRPLRPDEVFAISFMDSSNPAQIGFVCQADNRVLVEGSLKVTCDD
jgi:predicted hotdog family 3-hydroxylacyl-ACP dehydratase